MKKGRSAGVVSVAALLLASASVAWACTVQPAMSLRSTSPGATGGNSRDVTVVNPGSALVVEMTSVDLVDGSTPGRVEVRWNSLDGAVLGSAQGARASVPVRVPESAPPGVYTLVGVVLDPSGASTAKMSRAVRVVAPDGAAPASTTAWTNIEGAPISSASPGRGPSSAGVALLGFGLVALFSGFTLATVRRRRVASVARARH